MSFPDEWVKNAVTAESRESFLAASQFLICAWKRTLEHFGVGPQEARKAAESQALALRKLFCRVNAAPECFGGTERMSESERVKLYANSSGFHYPKDVADNLSIPPGPRKKVLKKIDRFIHASTKGHRWAKTEKGVSVWEKAALEAWCTIPRDVGCPLCLWTSGAIVERFRFCGAKISLSRVKNRLLTRWGLYQPKGLRYGTESLVQNVVTERVLSRKIVIACQSEIGCGTRTGKTAEQSAARDAISYMLTIENLSRTRRPQRFARRPHAFLYANMTTLRLITLHHV
jgi:hypothetical protein